MTLYAWRNSLTIIKQQMYVKYGQNMYVVIIINVVERKRQ